MASAVRQLTEQTASDTPRLDAELLLAAALNCSRTHLFTWPEQRLTHQQSEQFNDLLVQRLQGRPIAHILGQREFWGLALNVNASTLIPRPDTEILVETALEKLRENCPQKTQQAGSDDPYPACRVLDLGTGTGAIALALKSERPDCEMTGVDFSLEAVHLAQRNADALTLTVRFLQSDWFNALQGAAPFALIVSNPPYIEENDPHLSQGDVRFEPLSALTSGEDGLDDIRMITAQAGAFLQPGGWLIIEHGYNQAAAVQQLFKMQGFTQVETRHDYGGNPRITLGQKPQQSEKQHDHQNRT
nr:peptide chain release factor N(5)-glutamine methyltransferase [Thiomicrorhabdus cannonii]